MQTREELAAAMARAVAAEDFETAARLRDALAALAPPRPVRQTPGAMGLGTDQQVPVRPEGWTPPRRPDPMTKGRSRHRTAP